MRERERLSEREREREIKIMCMGLDNFLKCIVFKTVFCFNY